MEQKQTEATVEHPGALGFPLPSRCVTCHWPLISHPPPDWESGTSPLSKHRPSNAISGAGGLYMNGWRNAAFFFVLLKTATSVIQQNPTLTQAGQESPDEALTAILRRRFLPCFHRFC